MPWTNAAEARTIGAELELIAVQPIEALESAALGQSRGCGIHRSGRGCGNIRKGDRVTGVPENTLAASATYRWPLTAALDAFVFGQAQYTSDQVDVDQQYRTVATTSTLLGARLGVEGRAWGVYLFGDNLSDENARLVRTPVG